MESSLNFQDFLSSSMLQVLILIVLDLSPVVRSELVESFEVFLIFRVLTTCLLECLVVSVCFWK